jgi:hypothetical protein
MLTRRFAVTAAATAPHVRSYIEIGGETGYRLDKITSEADQKGALKKYWGDVQQRKARTFANRKEELAHLAERPSYEYVSDLQRAADDMTHVTSSPLYYATDIPYHYQKLWKATTNSKTNANDGNGEIEMYRIVPQ